MGKATEIKEKSKQEIKGLKDVPNLEEVRPEMLRSDEGVPFPALLLAKFKKFKGTCKLVRSMKKEQHRVMAYLESHARLDAQCVQEFDDSGTLSHLLLLFLARFETELKADKKQLPPEERGEPSELEEDDAERQTAFSQQQKRAQRKEGTEQMHAVSRSRDRKGNDERRSKGSSRRRARARKHRQTGSEQRAGLPATGASPERRANSSHQGGHHPGPFTGSHSRRPGAERDSEKRDPFWDEEEKRFAMSSKRRSFPRPGGRAELEKSRTRSTARDGKGRQNKHRTSTKQDRSRSRERESRYRRRHSSTGGDSRRRTGREARTLYGADKPRSDSRGYHSRRRGRDDHRRNLHKRRNSRSRVEPRHEREVYQASVDTEFDQRRPRRSRGRERYGDTRRQNPKQTGRRSRSRDRRARHPQ